jgi:hypothetical protein
MKLVLIKSDVEPHRKTRRAEAAWSMASLTGGVLLGFGALAAGLTELPKGPNRELVSKVCQSCHDLQMVFDAAGIGRDEWSGSLDEMTANGMSISVDDRAKILDYLSTYLGPSPPPVGMQR